MLVRKFYEVSGDKESMGCGGDRLPRHFIYILGWVNRVVEAPVKAGDCLAINKWCVVWSHNEP